ncbi:MAG: OmpP1/FadL family transporter [Opitutaceae bacterium]
MNTRSLLLRDSVAIASMLLSAPSLFGGGMALTLQNGASLGHAYSAGASAEDASTVFTNPAGLIALGRPQIVIGSTYVMFDGPFTNNGSLTAGALPTSGGNEEDAGLDKAVPSAFVAVPLGSQWAFGLGVSAPFGLGTSYDPEWVGRYHALHSELKTVNINPALAWRASERLSLGFGFNWQRAEATLTNAIDFGLIGFLNGVPGLLPGGLDGGLRIRGNDTTTGYNLGALLEVVDGARIGFHYRSKMAHTLEGPATFTNVPAAFAPLFPNQEASAGLPLPEVVSVSYYQELNPKLAVMVDWSWWNWSRFETLAVDFSNPLTPDNAQAQNWKDASIFSAGARWRSSASLLWRAGLAYNETPVPSAELRTARIPDSDRVWLALGATWHFNDDVRFDFGYAHLFMDNAPIANDDGLGHLLVGGFSLHIDIVSAQLTWGF